MTGIRNVLLVTFDHPAYAGVLAEMAGRLLSWRQDADERTLTHLHIADGVHAAPEERYSGMR